MVKNRKFDNSKHVLHYSIVDFTIQTLFWKPTNFTHISLMKFVEFVFSTFLRYPIRRIWSINGSKQFLGPQNSSNLTWWAISRHICQRSSFPQILTKSTKSHCFLRGVEFFGMSSYGPESSSVEKFDISGSFFIYKSPSYPQKPWFYNDFTFFCSKKNTFV